MDYEKYYDKKADGSYMIHFPNGKGLDLTELRNIFSAFGTVLSVNNRGQACGLCFVRYKHLEDVKRCIDGLQRHPFIKILQHVNKKKMQNKQLTHSSPKVDSMDDSFAAVKYLKKQFKQNQKGSFSDCENLSDVSVVSSKRSLRVSYQDPRKSSTIMEPPEKSSSCSSISLEVTTDKQKKINDTGNESEIPNLLTLYEKYCKENPKLCETSVQIIPSQEIIVANIHPSLSVHFILHLFEKYNPISVSMMRKTARAGIRYCHVYYRTNEEAYATIREFDGHSLQGKGLIVLTSQDLLKEALYKGTAGEI